jgi:hypothetical protein
LSVNTFFTTHANDLLNACISSDRFFVRMSVKEA